MKIQELLNLDKDASFQEIENEYKKKKKQLFLMNAKEEAKELDLVFREISNAKKKDEKPNRNKVEKLNKLIEEKKLEEVKEMIENNKWLLDIENTYVDKQKFNNIYNYDDPIIIAWATKAIEIKKYLLEKRPSLAKKLETICGFKNDPNQL